LLFELVELVFLGLQLFNSGIFALIEGALQMVYELLLFLDLFSAVFVVALFLFLFASLKVLRVLLIGNNYLAVSILTFEGNFVQHVHHNSVDFCVG